ncbi:RNase adapter RapZ [Deferribacter autotrophicus]|uniref:RNase adapter RapZ n=1 Tax=Deferribacter autotrophicus TaxID=500465 RepID=A0A5A8F4B9_9BACT|nr:RNase adapter RapZ [Deferribacter autotrophicus]KAA0258199.1 RNase adapter RapZ [Deferribacter autotrophicus]
MKKDLSIVIVTGLSGAGKSTAAKSLEDQGYYTVDNIPLFLAEKFFQFAYDFNVEIPKIAFVIDVRNKEFDKAYNFIKEIKNNYDADILFLEATQNVLLNRYKETRRKHPLGDDLLRAIEKEISLLSKIRDLSDFIIDTSNLNVNELSAKISELFSKRLQTNLVVTVQSFGFKYGIPPESDMVLDVRFLKNPHYVEKYRPLTGLDDEVKDYIFSDKRSKVFLRKLKSLLDFLIPNYMKEGKKYLTISIGCTGGKHRSVAIADFIYKYMLEKTNLNVNIKHRDMER